MSRLLKHLHCFGKRNIAIQSLHYVTNKSKHLSRPVDTVKSVWISPGITMGETLESHYRVGNTDVVVHLSDGSKHVATFFTYENINRIMKGHQQTGECLGGKYFWASDMIIIDSIDRASIEKVIHDLLAEETFQHVFKRVA